MNDLKSRGVELEEKEIYFGDFINGIREGMGLLKGDSTVGYGRFKDGEWSTDGVCIKGDYIYTSFENHVVKLIRHPTGELYLGETLLL